MSERGQTDALEQVLGPRGFEVTCEQCFELLDRYVDLEFGGGADEQLPGLRTHLQACPACREDHESLRALVRLDDEQR